MKSMISISIAISCILASSESLSEWEVTKIDDTTATAASDPIIQKSGLFVSSLSAGCSGNRYVVTISWPEKIGEELSNILVTKRFDGGSVSDIPQLIIGQNKSSMIENKLTIPFIKNMIKNNTLYLKAGEYTVEYNLSGFTAAWKNACGSNLL